MLCPHCNKPAIDGAAHPRCKKPYGLDGLTCFFRYRGVIRSFIHEIKYRLVSDSASFFVSLIPEATVRLIRPKRHDMPMVIVPVPLSSRRQKIRGFNQADAIAKALGHRLGLPIDTTILFRIKETPPQANEETRLQRLQNMKNAFLAVKGMHANRGIILCDDVYTTGATMKNAASALKRAGIKYVWGVAMAR
jgi:competence protein ComFC